MTTDAWFNLPYHALPGIGCPYQFIPNSLSHHHYHSVPLERGTEW
jgi:hypothetical protein